MSYIGIEPVPNKPLFRFRMPGKQLSKNLFKNTIDFGDESEICEDAIKVFLRVKPSPNENEDIVEKLDSKTIMFKMPADLTQSRKKLNNPVQYKYTFSNIFSSNVTQGEIFSGCVSNHVKDLFNGNHCLLFTYGTTNAGKTYTVLGTGDQPGIIPRTLTTVFKSIRGKEYGNDRIIPCMFNSAFEIESSKTLESERLFKSNVLSWNPDRTQGDSYRSQTCRSQISNQSSVDEILGEAVFQQMQKRLTNDTSIIEYEAEPEDRFSVWVSFAEIYNEAIYDLLQPVPINGKRAQLKLAHDNHKNTFIKGLHQVNVQSEEEAYKVLMFGKNNLQVAATGLNSSSSRSHCVFTIKLMKCPNVEHPEKVVVSSFSICDLAGAERQKKTLNIGLRLKESQNINCSLHVLSRCFSIIRDNQLNNQHKPIPFRDSKLTQLFQHALLGKESVTMIVNVNPDRDLCEETEHVLKASAIAKHIIVQPKPVVRPRPNRTSTFSQLVRKKANRSSPIRWDSCIKAKVSEVQSIATIEDSELTEDEHTELENKAQQYENLLEAIESLKEKLKEEKDKNLQFRKTCKLREDQIREEMSGELQNLMKNAEKQNALDLERLQKRALDDRSDGRVINPVVPTKKAKLYNILEEFEGEISNGGHVKDLKDEIDVLQKEIDGLTRLVNIYVEEKRELTMGLTSTKLQLGWKDREIVNLKNKIEMFAEESEVHAAYLELEKEMEQKIKERNVLLEEARNDLLEELSNNEDLEADVAKLEKELVGKDEEIATFQTKIDDLRQEIDVKTDTMDMMENLIEELEQKSEQSKESFEKMISKLDEDLRVKNDEYCVLKKNIDSNEETLSSLQSENVQLKNLVTDLNNEISILENELTAYRKNNFDKTNEEDESKKLYTQEEFDEEMVRVTLKLSDDFDKTNEEEASKKVYTQEEFDEEMVRVTLKLSEDLENEFKKSSERYESTISTLHDQIKETYSEKNYLHEELEKTKTLLCKCNLDLSNQAEQLCRLEKTLENFNEMSKETERDLQLEISRLEKDSKSQAQGLIKLHEKVQEKEKQIHKMHRNLKESMTEIETLRENLKLKDDALKCSINQNEGYAKTLPSLQAAFERQQKEMVEYKKKCDDFQAAKFNLEHERYSFLEHQKEIIGKYEDQLKKTKEENENLKKEVARVTTTFYKSTPTPKKDLEKQVQLLKKQLEEERELCKEKHIDCANDKAMIDNIEVSSEVYHSNESNFYEGPDKENVFESKRQTKHTSRNTKIANYINPPQGSLSNQRIRSKSHCCDENSDEVSKPDYSRSKSASKARPERALRSTKCENSVANDENEARINKPKKVKKKLHTYLSPNACDLNNVSNEDCEPLFPHEESPGRTFRRTLRTRKQ